MSFKYHIYAVCTAALLLSYGCGSHANAESAFSSETSQVSLNKGNARALLQIKGMNAYKAHAIVAYRHKNGAFLSLNELHKVKGFKRMKPESMQAIIEHLQLD